MKRFILAFVLCLCCITSVTPAQARGEPFLFSFGLGAACCGFYSHYYAPYYGAPYYGAPYYPSYSYGYPVYYTAPAQTIMYAQPAPAPTTYAAPAPQTLEASQASSVFVDNRGRTCRKFQSSMNGAPVKGTACLHPDGTWHTVGE